MWDIKQKKQEMSKPNKYTNKKQTYRRVHRGSAWYTKIAVDLPLCEWEPENLESLELSSSFFLNMDMAKEKMVLDIELNAKLNYHIWKHPEKIQQLPYDQWAWW